MPRILPGGGNTAGEEGLGKPVLRSIFLLSAIVSAVALGGCNTESTGPVNGRHMRPLSERLIADLESRDMAKGSPILARIFKEESELEVWKVEKTGLFSLLRTYPICRWSGDLGPKFLQGDRQAPEGFYTITPGLMNPNSNEASPQTDEVYGRLPNILVDSA